MGILGGLAAGPGPVELFGLAPDGTGAAVVLTIQAEAVEFEISGFAGFVGEGFSCLLYPFDAADDLTHVEPRSWRGS